MSTLAPGERVGAYTVCELIGRGGNSMVYRGRETQRYSTAALKVLAIDRGSDGERERAHLAHQARMLATVTGEHAPRVLGLDTTGDYPHLAMTLVAGRSMASRLRDRGPLMLAEARGLITNVADALQRIHDDGVLHLDLTPSNVVLDGTAVCIVDFGAALAMSEVGEQHARTIEGTSGYVALERCLGALPTRQMDIFSLGALTYRALIGIRPYADERSLAATRRLGPKRLIRPVLLRPAIGPFVSDLLERTLALDPRERPGSAREFAEAFAVALPRSRVR